LLKTGFFKQESGLKNKGKNPGSALRFREMKEKRRGLRFKEKKKKRRDQKERIYFSHHLLLRFLLI
jgi:hypothetical protein